MTYDNEAIVRHAYHTAEGRVLDVAGFVGSFAEDGVIRDPDRGTGACRPRRDPPVDVRDDPDGYHIELTVPFDDLDVVRREIGKRGLFQEPGRRPPWQRSV